ncbi:SDR family NAD(P)-dependent oxidoreductase [Varunaivibrio sulfuroxidans]|uniref:NAD(P)-dependent dehydrogenase (Short-subunit alcohol dehydrogenase family) n=1 Tax=Varunaivibrio sulfuroxidans TaxID=1773489 RepID=A0A4R3JG86_9PROT|nr:SDR family NAD(P)-dependent oxidoreductase [Varunaivibrio sulfuroxidans]TCS64934.1 NAD(P)-dependent dehydrogenase (short-subunit alcohol dehydrogenase family) [Varunaivibrio sulfuroxidans]WES29774.1 SDR family NAD(P)-dependent oxidoreductase [Varunaivibrio sulfuroxidans]
MDFDGRHVVVTGGTGALGSAVTARVLNAGGYCHIPVFDAREIQNFAHKDHSRVSLTPGVDLTDEAAAVAYFAALPGLWASVHIAGGFAMADLTETTKATFMAQWSLNALSCFLCCREAVKTMRSHAPDGGGRIVNVAARPALEPRGGAGMAAYTASKAAVAALTQALGEELAPEGIWVNAVAPSILDTPANRAVMTGAQFEAWPKVDEVATAITFLASPENGAARGSLVSVYGRS